MRFNNSNQFISAKCLFREVCKVIAHKNTETHGLKTIVMEDFNIQYSPLNSSFRQDLCKYIRPLNEKLEELELMDLFKTFQVQLSENTIVYKNHLETIHYSGWLQGEYTKISCIPLYK